MKHQNESLRVRVLRRQHAEKVRKQKQALEQERKKKAIEEMEKEFKNSLENSCLAIKEYYY